MALQSLKTLGSCGLPHSLAASTNEALMLPSSARQYNPYPVQYNRMLVLIVNLMTAVFASRSDGENCSTATGVSTLPAPSTHGLNCEEAEQFCIGRLVCGMAFHSHLLDCRGELAGRTPGRCSIYCRQSLVSLASTEEGYTYIGCECGRNDFCRALRERLAPCWWQEPCPTAPSTANVTSGFQLPGGLTLISFSSPPSAAASFTSTKPRCSQLALDCSSDPVCSMAWNYYRHFCQDVLNGLTDNCSTRCSNSVRILMRMEEAHRLLDCECDKRLMRALCENELRRIRRVCFRVDGLDANHGGESPSVSVILVLCVLLHAMSLRTD